MIINRVGSVCWFRLPGRESLWQEGWLHAWSTDHAEFESGPGMYPVGVIEDCDTGKCYSTYVENISFAKEAPE